jgi:ribosomal protein L34E
MNIRTIWTFWATFTSMFLVISSHRPSFLLEQVVQAFCSNKFRKIITNIQDVAWISECSLCGSPLTSIQTVVHATQLRHSSATHHRMSQPIAVANSVTILLKDLLLRAASHSWYKVSTQARTRNNKASETKECSKPVSYRTRESSKRDAS